MLGSTLARSRAAAAVLVAMLVCTGLARAGKTYWQHDPSSQGDWFAPANWSSGVPSSGSIAYIDNGGTALLDSTAPARVFQLYVGDAATGGVVQESGTLLLDTWMVLGSKAASNGRYELRGGQIPPGNLLVVVGDNGTGLFVQTGGEAHLSRVLVGRRAGCHGRFELTDGDLWTRKTYVGGFYKSAYPGAGTGTFIQSGGRHTLSEELYLGGLSSVGHTGDGTYEMQGGSLVAPTIYAGWYDTGRFLQTGGTVAGNVLIGHYGGSRGTYDMSGGELTAAGVSIAHARCGSAAGEFTQSGGSVITPRLAVASRSTTNQGRYAISGGSLMADEVRLSLDFGCGTFAAVGHGGVIQMGTLTMGPTAALESVVSASGLSEITVLGQAVFDGSWNVMDDGARFGTFTVLTAGGGIAGAFDAVNLPGPDWSWGITNGDTLWVEHVPEPAALSLLALGACLPLLRRRK